MKSRSLLAATVFVASAFAPLAGCSPSEDASSSEDAWVGTVTTEGDVTTVINEAGSVWGGTATLVEEASIGVDAGDDPYMLGRVRSITAGNERIYVVDAQVPAVRVYNRDGAWLHDIGGEGQGPGEFQAPSSVAVDAEGRVWVHEQSMTRMLVFSPDGEVLATHNLGGTRISGSNSSMTLTPDGWAYVFDVVRPEDPGANAEVRIVMKPFDIDGNAGGAIDIPQFENTGGLEARSANAVRFTGVPFHPSGTTDFTADRMVLSGYPDAYRFEMLHLDGRRTIVERAWQPVVVHPEEAEAYRDAVTAYMRDMVPEWTWSGPEIPPTKMAFTDLVPTAGGEIWVVRPGAGSPVRGCDPAAFDDVSSEPPCWEEERIVDAFGADGRYLGAVDVPAEVSFRPPPFIRGDEVIAMVEDDAGTIMVKRYRRVLPGAR